MDGAKGMNSLRYYFFDLPLWGLGVRSERLARRLENFLSSDALQFRTAFTSLNRYLGQAAEKPPVEEMAGKALWVRIIRESDAYASLLMTKKKMKDYFRVEGMEHLTRILPSRRPIFLLTGHIGSFFIPAIAFAHMNVSVYPIARTVGTAHELPFARRLFEKLNYTLSEMRFSSRYIFTSYPGIIDRSLIHICKSGGLVWAAIDFPRSFYPFKRTPVKLLGFTSSLPSGLVRLGLKYDAVFLTAWNTVETDSPRHFYRRLTIDPPLPEGIGMSAILQNYADRLSSVVIRQPWEWAGIQVIDEFCEKEACD